MSGSLLYTFSTGWGNNYQLFPNGYDAFDPGRHHSALIFVYSRCAFSGVRARLMTFATQVGGVSGDIREVREGLVGKRLLII